MKPDLQRLDAAISAMKHLRAAQVDYQRKRDRAGSVSTDGMWRRRDSLSASMHVAAMDVERQWDTLHAALVDLGICPPKDAAAYDARAQHLSGFHDHAYQPAVPATIQDSLMVGAQAHPKQHNDGGADAH
ncbi:MULTISPECIES: hypothetical protein [Achromobacter]|uniref:hypothetical protein n=1 Tax=Achromobacter sp. ACM03 TaxID=2769300 RepID=UPI001CE06A45|nr:hypothetical protein [Achromobacter sp. ACM03]